MYHEPYHADNECADRTILASFSNCWPGCRGLRALLPKHVGREWAAQTGRLVNHVSKTDSCASRLTWIGHEACLCLIHDPGSGLRSTTARQLPTLSRNVLDCPKSSPLASRTSRFA